ncbi:MAG TPA: ASCH domain-containing protein [Gemmatimonadaceae bacterium]|nr:ASCH domain-containing protein [Gemmatimonadaceae bacterium]
MRVLSVQQPFATLIVRGVKRVEVRSWETDYRGRIAIHASAAVPPHEIQRQWYDDRAMGRSFADQGWLDREDLKALPRSAIVGTVELAGVDTGGWDPARSAKDRLFSFNPITDIHELIERDPHTGESRRVRSPLQPLAATFKPSDFLWALRQAVEIEPIMEVSGRLNLWNLNEELSRRVAEREEKAQAGVWRPPQADRKRRAESLKQWRERWLSALELDVRAIEESVRQKREARSLEFTGDVERRFQETLARYLAENGVEQGVGAGHVRLDRRLRRVFDGRKTVPRAELELELRRYVKREVERERVLARERQRRRRLMKLLLELRKRRKYSDPPQTDRQIKAKVEEVLEQVLDRVDRGEEDDEDIWTTVTSASL